MPDVLRHTSISHQLERDKDEALVVLNNGTGVQMLHRHYVDLIEDPAENKEFWALTPSKIRAANVKLAETKQPKRIPWPDDKALTAMVAQKSVVRIATELGVSDNAVRKHCKKQGIKLPNRRGYTVAR